MDRAKVVHDPVHGSISVDGVFMETHLDPRRAKSDAANAIRFSELERLWKVLLRIHADVS